MKLFFKEYFTFRKNERNAIMVLLFFLGIIVFVFYLDSYSVNSKRSELYTLPIDSVFVFSNVLKNNYKNKVIAERTLSMFRFDPNSTTNEEWLKLGLSKWQIKVVNSYLEKAERFKNKEHFLKLEIFSEEEKIRLGEYVYLKKDTTLKNNIPKTVLIELNSCFEDDLRSIKGIGFSYSERIVKYRNLLGGYYEKYQLYEVYGMDSVYCDSILPFFHIDTSLLRKININKCPAQVLYNHPYITWNVANAIVNYRDQHGDYKSVLEIQNTDLVNPDLYRKIAPYFSLVE